MGDPETPNPSKKLPQYLAALAATGGAFAAGTTLGWSSPTMSKLVTKNESKEEYDYIITEQEFAWVGSLVTLGAAIVCLFIGPVIQILGRKLTMLLDIIPFTLGWLLVIISGFVKNSLAMLYIGRILLGISGGAFCVAAPTYTGEIAQPSIRGALGSFFQLMLVIGILFVYAVGPYVSVVVLSSICATIPIIFGLIFIWMPESPTFLISKGKTEEAIKSLKWLRGNQYDYSNELAELQAQDEADKKNKVSLVAALKRRSTIKAILIGMGLMFFQQMSGINAVIFFSEDIFKAAKSNEEGGLKAAEETIIVGVMQVVAVFVSSIIVDKLGRRWLLLPSIIVMGICNILLGTYFFLEDKTSIGWLPITSLCIFIILFSLGFGPIPWLMMGELFSNDIKGVASSAAGCFSWTLAFIITSTFKAMIDAFESGPTFMIFAGFCVLGAVLVFLFVPETKGKSLIEIQRILEGEIFAINSGRKNPGKDNEEAIDSEKTHKSSN